MDNYFYFELFEWVGTYFQPELQVERIWSQHVTQEKKSEQKS